MEQVLHRGIVPHLQQPMLEEAHTLLQARLRTQCESERGKPVDHWRQAAPHPILQRIESLSPCYRTSDAALGSPGESAVDSSQRPPTIHSSRLNSTYFWGPSSPNLFVLLPS